MTYKIDVVRQSDQSHHVEINGLHVGTGTRKMCRALAREFKRDETKAKLVYDLEKEENHG